MIEYSRKGGGWMLEIIRETAELALCVKPVGVRAQGEGENDLPALLSRQLGCSIYPVHRLDQAVGGVMGFAGMVIGVPLFAVLYSVLTEKINHLLKKRGLSVDTNDYRGHRRIDPETHAFVEAQETTPPVSAKERRRAANAAQQKNQENKNQ